MKVVVDECLPKRLCRDFAEHEAVTVSMIGLAGIENSELMRRLDGRCDAFVTIDANLAHQQNLSGLSFAVIVVKAATNKFEDVHPLAGQILAALASIQPGQIKKIPG